jgi:hypothetical protein
MLKKVGPETSPTDCTCPVQPIYMMKKVASETFPTDCTWFVQHIYIYIYDENSWSRDFPYRLYMVCIAYIYDEKCRCSYFSYSLYMASKAKVDMVRGTTTATRDSWGKQMKPEKM